MQITTDLAQLIAAGSAVGTLLVAIFTAYQLWQFRRDRKAAQIRELDERVYTPLHKELDSWINPPDALRAMISAKTWKELNENMLYLTSKIPYDLAQLLNKIQVTFERMTVVKIIVVKALQTKFGDRMVRLTGDGLFFGGVELIDVWVSGKSLDEWCEAYATNRSVDDWDVELLNNAGYHEGGKEEVEALLGKMSELLKSMKEAKEFKEKTKDMMELGGQALTRIDEEMHKPFAPWS